MLRQGVGTVKRGGDGASAKDSGLGKTAELLPRTCLECWDCRE